METGANKNIAQFVDTLSQLVRWLNTHIERFSAGEMKMHNIALNTDLLQAARTCAPHRTGHLVKRRLTSR